VAGREVSRGPGGPTPCHGAAWPGPITSQFLGKEFIKFAHEIMHHFMLSSTLHLHTFQSFALFLN
jgi:hypothetical protein